LSEYQRKLDELLQEVDPGLVEFRLGCWSAFRAKGYDYVGQASSSMRRLVTDVLVHIAPDDKVLIQIISKTPLKLKREKEKYHGERAFFVQLIMIKIKQSIWRDWLLAS